MTNLVEVHTKKTTDNALAIEYLEMMLEQAKNGELIQFCAIALYSDGDYGSVWTRQKNMVEVSGMCARLQYLLQKEMDPQE